MQGCCNVFYFHQAQRGRELFETFFPPSIPVLELALCWETVGLKFRTFLTELVGFGVFFLFGKGVIDFWHTYLCC